MLAPDFIAFFKAKLKKCSQFVDEVNFKKSSLIKIMIILLKCIPFQGIDL